MRKLLFWILAANLIWATGVRARQIETGIVQIKMDRIYFSSGSESGVKAGSPFVIECGGNEILSGALEYAGPGISYSRPLAEIDSLEIDPQCIVRLTTSAIDSSAIITIGTDIPFRFFDLDHETLFQRRADTVLPNLVDSTRTVGNMTLLYLSHDVQFSDGTPLNATLLASFFEDIKDLSRSNLVRYFFARLLPLDSGGVEVIDPHTIRLSFYSPFPRAAYFLSHPDFAVYNAIHAGTGALALYPDPEGGVDQKVYVPNRHYRGEPAAFARLIVRQYEQQYRLKFAYENGQIDGFIGFGFEADLAGTYEARALYPEVAVMIAGLGGELFSQGIFPTSLYYCFNPALSHIYFQYGETIPVNRWMVTSGTNETEPRFYPFDFLAGRRLHESIRSKTDSALIVYDDTPLYETARYLADIVAREGMSAPIKRQSFEGPFDIRLMFYPASDRVMPFALVAAVLELNDQNRYLPPGRRMDRPAWQELGQGSSLSEIRNRDNFFAKAEETVVQDGGFFPLFRPYIYAVGGADIRGLIFDFYGYPELDRMIKFSDKISETVSEPKP
jgi:hypothetical protein